MPPTFKREPDLRAQVQQMIDSHSVVVFSKSYCPFCHQVKDLFKSKRIDYEVLEVDLLGQDGVDIQNELKNMTGQATVPSVFIKGRHIGGADDTMRKASEGSLFSISSDEDATNEYDLVVIGGGSGGLSCAKEAASLGLRVAVCDFVKPSPPGTTWGLGGTCVNVGCIPKKLMHQASLLGESLQDARAFGWQLGDGDGDFKPTLDWSKMIEAVQSHVKSLNWGYKVQLRDKKVKYLNELARFTAPNTLETTNKKGQTRTITASNFVVAVGGRPNYPNEIPGAKEYCITSDDLFSLDYNPGKTLFVGASYISLECAGFLKGLGLDVTVMVRSILLRGFDQQMAEMIGEYMENHAVNFIRPCVPTKIELIEEGKPGKLKVTGQYSDGTEFCDEFNTVLFAVGRTADTGGLGLDNVGVEVNAKNLKIVGQNGGENTNVDNVYAIGDVLDGKPELTPVAIQAGKLLARRIAGSSKAGTDYEKISTTVFTPIEYGCCGLSEEDAMDKLGSENVEVYHTNHWPLEWTVPKRPENACYAKLICDKNDDERVVGFHYLGPNAGEVTQGFAGMIKLNATKDDFDDLVGIHPTCAELFTTMKITKSSGAEATASGC